jgi:hypothetical protein
VVITPNQLKNLRGRYGSAGNKDDRFDAFVFAYTLRTDRARLRPLLPDSPATVNDGPKQQHGRLPTQARVPPGAARTVSGRPAVPRPGLLAGGHPLASGQRLKMISMEPAGGQNRPGRRQWSPGPASLVG